MSSSSANSFDHFSAASAAATGTDSFDGGYSFPNFDSNVADFPPSVYVSGGEFFSDPAYLSSETNEDGLILPPPVEMEHEECYAVREWRRQNTIRLEEKEKKEKELLCQIIEQADEYKVEFNRKRVASCETNKVTNREKEQVFVAIQEKFHAEAGKDYWKSIAEIIPKELPTIEKRKDTKEQAKKASSVTVIQGPKPGKPSDLSRMRQILLNLKHNTPPHLKQLEEAGNTEAVAVA